MTSTKRPPVALGEWQVLDSTTKSPVSDGHVPREWLMALGEGDLPDAQREHTMAHLASCETCRRAAGGLGLEATVRFDPNVFGGRPAADHESLIGTMLGEYRVEELLDQGAMGVVYRGMHPVIGKPVAIKVMQRDFARDTENNHRLIAEARAVNAIGHPNIVDVFSFGTLPDGRQYLVMELLTGKNLRVLGRDAGVPLAEALDILLQVSAALGAAHAAGVVHRDLKPSNIFVSRHLGAVHVTVLDFGVAKGLNRSISSVATQPGMVIGTAGFMAPEQILGGEVGPPADVYALGCVAWWLFAREEVFSGSDDALYRRHVETPAPPLASRVRVPASLDALVNAMLAKQPVGRPTAAEAQQRFARLVAELRPVHSPGADDVPTQPPMVPVRASGPKLFATTQPVEPVLAAPTLPEMPRFSPPSPSPSLESEETLKPPRQRSSIVPWVLVALLAAAAIAFVVLKLR